MTLREILTDIHALEEELLQLEAKYGVRSATFYAAYASGEEPEDDSWTLDLSEWASVYRTWLARQAEYRNEIARAQTTPPDPGPKTFNEIVEALKRIGPPDEDFARDLEEIHRSQPTLPGDPWARRPIWSWQEEILEERLERLDENPDDGSTWEDVKAELWPKN